MKISKIEIKEYNQFRNFSLDLTYPAGHAKAGQPLDKVCFIGQSGTGKTTILNEIWYKVTGLAGMAQYGKEGWESWADTVMPDMLYSSGTFLHNTAEITIGQRKIKVSPIIAKNSNLGEYFENLFQDTKQLGLFFPTDWTWWGVLYDNKEDSLNKIREKIHTDNGDNTNYWEDYLISRQESAKKADGWDKYYRTYDFNDDKDEDDLTVRNLWDYIFMKMLKEKETNKDVYKDLAEKLNKILNKFHVYAKNEDFYGYLDIRHKSGQYIDSLSLSSGIQRLIEYTVFLYKLDTNQTMIFIDEPERSLYPDLQREIVAYYTSLAPTAQFFFATHSPVIASSFEPWEVVELQFDEDGYVQQRPYFEGERHVDNYTIYPQYLRWDSILIDMFGIDTEGNTARDGKLDELYAIKKQMQALSKTGGNGTLEMEALSQKYDAAATLLGWRFDK